MIVNGQQSSVHIEVFVGVIVAVQIEAKTFFFLSLSNEMQYTIREQYTTERKDT